MIGFTGSVSGVLGADQTSIVSESLRNGETGGGKRKRTGKKDGFEKSSAYSQSVPPDPDGSDEDDEEEEAEEDEDDDYDEEEQTNRDRESTIYNDPNAPAPSISISIPLPKVDQQFFN